MAICLSFLVPKITAIVHATPTNARPTPSAWNHEHDRVSDFVPIASLLEWQWHQIVMRNCQFYHSSRNGASQTGSHTRSQSHFTQCYKHGLVSPPPTPPSPPTVSSRNWIKYNKFLKDSVRGAASTQVQIRSYRQESITVGGVYSRQCFV